MDHFTYRNGVLCCEDVSLEDIAAAVGTPVYVYSTATLARHYRVFAEAFAPRTPLIAYAVKANSNIAVIATLVKLGAGADTVSGGEIKRALAAGCPPARIVFSGVGKSEEELRFAIRTGVHQINVESVAEFDLLAQVAAEERARPAIAIRINPDLGAGAHAKISTGHRDDKFGVSVEDALALYARAARHPALNPQGLAVHIGSQIRDLAPLEAVFPAMRRLVEQLRNEGLSIAQLDLGGGLGVPYFHEPEPPSPADYGAMVNRVFDGLDIGLAFEPGRLIAGNAGVLLTRVLRRQERPERRIVVVDAAMNDFVRPAMYDAFHALKPVRERTGAPLAPQDIVGPVCESGDTFAKDRALPALEAGDLAVFQTAGAYGASMSSTYNTRPLVPEVLVNGARFAVVRRRFEVEDQLALESLPDWAI